MNVLRAVRTCGKGIISFASAHTSELLTVGAIVGVVATVVVTPDMKTSASEVIAKAKRDLEDVPEDDKETRRVIGKEMVVGVAKASWKTMLVAGLTIGCIYGIHHINVKKIAALSSLCALSANQIEDLTKFKERAAEFLGEEKSKEIQHEVTEERMKQNPGSTMPLPGEPSVGMDIWYDEFSDRYFYSSMAIIEKAVNKLNSDLANDNQPYVELDDFYDEIGLYSANERTDYARLVGWSNFCKADRIELIFDTFHSDIYGKAVNSFSFSTPPSTEFKHYRSVLG